MFRFRGSLWVGLALLAPALAGAQPPTVRSAAPQRPPRTVALQELWRVGGDEGDVVFGMVIDCVEDGDGNLYLLDSQLAQIEVFSPDGEHLRTLSRQGEGPGEMRNPQSLALLEDGTLAALEFFPARFVTMTTEGEPLTGLVYGGQAGPRTGYPLGFRVERRGGTLLMAAHHSTPSDVGQDRTQFLVRLAPDGREVVRFREATMSLDFTQPRFVESEILPAFLLTCALDDAGRVYVPRSRQEYAVEVYDPDGSLVRVIEREFPPLRRDDRELARLDVLVDAWSGGLGDRLARDLDADEPPITELHVDDEGTLWVQHARSGRDRPTGVLLKYDTFGPDGRWLQEVSVAAEGDPDFDGLIFLHGDRVLLVRGYVLARWASRGAQNVSFGEEDSGGPMEIVCCRMVPR